MTTTPRRGKTAGLPTNDGSFKATERAESGVSLVDAEVNAAPAEPIAKHPREMTREEILNDPEFLWTPKEWTAEKTDRELADFLASIRIAKARAAAEAKEKRLAEEAERAKRRSYRRPDWLEMTKRGDERRYSTADGYEAHDVVSYSEGRARLTYMITSPDGARAEVGRVAEVEEWIVAHRAERERVAAATTEADVEDARRREREAKSDWDAALLRLQAARKTHGGAGWDEEDGPEVKAAFDDLQTAMAAHAVARETRERTEDAARREQYPRNSPAWKYAALRGMPIERWNSEANGDAVYIAADGAYAWAAEDPERDDYFANIVYGDGSYEEVHGWSLESVKAPALRALRIGREAWRREQGYPA